MVHTTIAKIVIIAIDLISSKSCLKENILLKPFKGLILLALGFKGFAVTIQLCCRAFPKTAITTPTIKTGAIIIIIISITFDKMSVATSVSRPKPLVFDTFSK